MKELIALRPMTYGPRRMRVGEVFTAQDSHARLLVSIGRARPVDRPPPQCEVLEEATMLRGTSMPSERVGGPMTLPPMEFAAEEPKPQRRKQRKQGTYKRRDMRAED